MVEETRKGRTLDSLESIATEFERLRLLREYEMCVRMVDAEGSLWVRPVERGWLETGLFASRY